MPPARKYIPSARALKLARLLRDARNEAGLSAAAVGARLGWSQGKVSHIESCRNKADVDDVALLLDIYGVISPDRDAILTLAREADQRNWWADYADVFMDPYPALEDAAEGICCWSPLLIPGLLQTQDSARAIMTAGNRAGGDGDRSLDRRLLARMARQTILTRPSPPKLHVVLDETVLLRPVGGVDILRAQLAHLVAMAKRSNVTIQVLPIAAGGHIGLEGAFIVLRFTDPADPDIGYAEGRHGAAIMENPRKVAECNLAFEALSDIALSPAESVAMIKARAENQ